jgi:hypothetical protein
MSDAERRLRGFARSMLRAFDAADKYAADRLGVRGTETAISASGLSRGASTATAESRAMLERLHALCVRQPITELCSLLGVPHNAENPVERALCTDKRDKKASSQHGKQQAMRIAQQISITPQDLQAVMQAITDAFVEVENSLSRTRSKRGWVSDYKPDWRTRFLVWELVKSFGRITAPEEISFDFKRLKQAVFAAMFNGNYLNEQRKRARFRDTLLRHIPMPAQLDANITWLAVRSMTTYPNLSLSLFSFCFSLSTRHPMLCPPSPSVPPTFFLPPFVLHSSRFGKCPLAVWVYECCSALTGLHLIFSLLLCFFTAWLLH